MKKKKKEEEEEKEEEKKAILEALIQAEIQIVVWLGGRR